MAGDVAEPEIDPRELKAFFVAYTAVGLTRRQAYALIESRAVQHWRIGSRIYVRVADLRAAFLAARIPTAVEG